MKNIYTLLIAFGLILAVCIPSYSQENISSDNLWTFDGKISSVKISKRVITVEGALTRTFELGRDTKIIYNGRSIGISDLSKGDYISVGYSQKMGGPIEVNSVNVRYRGSQSAP